MEIPRGRGDLKAKLLEGQYEAKLEFPGGRGGAKQKTFRGGVWIFSGTTQSKKLFVFQIYATVCGCILAHLLLACSRHSDGGV